ncbi:MAG: 50S ribosomal protein L28 [Candidatus Omnitrophota bacterium]|nr:MAG: 50S ribosomal protein L28 [Candidatus Omnitrophota bacterium]
MSKFCKICGKGPTAGRAYSRRGLAKKKGGVGKKITEISIRRFLPNLQKIKIILSGVKKKTYVCTRCIRSGKVTKA